MLQSMGLQRDRHSLAKTRTIIMVENYIFVLCYKNSTCSSKFKVQSLCGTGVLSVIPRSGLIPIPSVYVTIPP